MTIALAAFFLLLASNSYGGQVAHVDKTVQHLIAHVAQSDLIFIRNDVRYTGKEASEDMQKKYAHFRGRSLPVVQSVFPANSTRTPLRCQSNVAQCQDKHRLRDYFA